MGPQSLWIRTELGAMAHRHARFSNTSKLATAATLALTWLGGGALFAQEAPTPGTNPPLAQQSSPAPSVPNAMAAPSSAAVVEPAPTSTVAEPSLSPAAAPIAAEGSGVRAAPAPGLATTAPPDTRDGQLPLHGSDATANPVADAPVPALTAPAQSAAEPSLAHDIAAPGDTPAPGESSLVNAQKLPHDLSPWGMFMQADLVVKSVMIGLILASVITWTVWLAKSLELMASRARLRRGLRKLSDANSISEAMALVDAKRGAVPAMLRAALAETRASWDVADKYAIKDRIKARLERVELAAGRDISRGTGLLATIGSTAPFVGLFGTVWGIMNSFIGISEAQTTNLAIVAPGIAEALLATAFGLVAAIPAVMIYNHFARSIAGYKALVGDASVAVLCIVSRDFDRGVRPELRAAE